MDSIALIIAGSFGLILGIVITAVAMRIAYSRRLKREWTVGYKQAELFHSRSTQSETRFI